MKSGKIISLSFCLVFLLLFLWAQFFSSPYEKYKELFLSTPGVSAVNHIYENDDSIYAEISLKNGGRLYVGPLAENYFTSTDLIIMHGIGDAQIYCKKSLKDEATIVGRAFNVADVIRRSDLGIAMSNMEDLVMHYDAVKDYLEKKIPSGKLSPIRIGARELFCELVRLSPEQLQI